MRTVNVTKAIILNQKGEVLLLRRSKTDTRRPGQWDFPGGGVEDGEDFTFAVAREIAEEAGLQIMTTELSLVYAATEIYRPGQESVNRLLFTTRLTDDQPIELSFEHDFYKWVDIDTALAEFRHPFYNPGLRYARENNLL